MLATPTIPQLDIDALAEQLEDNELCNASKDPLIQEAQVKINELIDKTNMVPEAGAIIGIVKVLLAQSNDIEVGSETRKAGLSVLKWLAGQLKTSEGKANLKSTIAFMDELNSADSALWVFLVPVAGAVNPVLTAFKDAWQPDLPYEEKEALVRNAIAQLTKSLATTFPIREINLPQVEVPGLGGTLQLSGLTISDVNCTVAPPRVEGSQLQTAVPRIDYRPMQTFALTVSDLSFNAVGSFERRNSRLLSDYNGVGKISANGCSVRFAVQSYPDDHSPACRPISCIADECDC